MDRIRNFTATTRHKHLSSRLEEVALVQMDRLVAFAVVAC